MEDVEIVLERFRGRIGLSKDPSDLVPDDSSSVSGASHTAVTHRCGLVVDFRDSHPHS